jgi:hypothetical protein
MDMKDCDRLLHGMEDAFAEGVTDDSAHFGSRFESRILKRSKAATP